MIATGCRIGCKIGLNVGAGTGIGAGAGTNAGVEVGVGPASASFGSVPRDTVGSGAANSFGVVNPPPTGVSAPDLRTGRVPVGKVEGAKTGLSGMADTMTGTGAAVCVPRKATC